MTMVLLLRNALLAVHVLGAVAWVGGMLFAMLVLRPALTVLEPPQRLALHLQVFTRFFRLIWHVWPLMLLTGYGMIFGLYGGMRGVNIAVHAMHGLGLLMTVIFLVVWFGPFRRFRAFMAAGDTAAAAGCAAHIRQLILANLVLGLITVVLGAFG